MNNAQVTESERQTIVAVRLQVWSLLDNLPESVMTSLNASRRAAVALCAKKHSGIQTT